jgi:hypothetical protein
MGKATPYIVSALVALAAGGFGFLLGNDRGKINGRIEARMERAFHDKYDPPGQILNDPEASRQAERQRAFLWDHVPENPYYNNRDELSKLAEEGRVLKQQITKEERDRNHYHFIKV